MSSSCRAFACAFDVDDAAGVHLIVECQAVAVDPTQRQSRTDVDGDVVIHVNQERSWLLMSLEDVSAFHSIHDVEDFCVWSANSSYDIADGRTRIRKVCRTARVCLGNVVWVSNSTRMFDGSRGILEAHLCHLELAGAFEVVRDCVVTMLTWVRWLHFVNLLEEMTREKRKKVEILEIFINFAVERARAMTLRNTIASEEVW